ncbi:putative anion transporter 6, chloroplastic isoform X1 [Cinnamomum micranthum f. kanehirae]|uniref:Putative anion transporter 6, chloroplastic isoform X1 n=1 Tax=Cinnamomum micranthum f. kanehirae TaxID=337451 RepID=A0A3S3MW42_9MAGN|nr:putative anion transporter 6, chloroplastic isoform X1 [Cinnamomum micranthum f. kanehirae]
MATSFSIRPFSSSRSYHPRSSSFPRNSQMSTSRNPFLLFPSNQTSRFRISSSIKGKGEVSDKETNKIPTGLRTDRDLQIESVDERNPSLSKEKVSIDSYEGFEWKWPPWKHLPYRYKIISATSLAFVVCNMDKVNLSVAIIPMSHQFGWNASMAGLVQSSFFWGYALSQLPGGWLAKIFGGRTIPIQERSRAVAFVFGGLSIGSVMGLLLAPPIIQSFGWESVFYIFGFLGILWCLGFELIKEAQTPFVDEYTLGARRIANGSVSTSVFSSSKSWDTSFRELGTSLKDVPWKEFFKSQAVWAMIYAHFCGSWGHYTCLSWLPTYFSEELDLNLTEAAWVSVLPPLASFLVTSIAAPFADNLISTGVETTMVRKICQTIAFMSPAVCMTLSSLDLGLPPWEVVLILTAGLALSSFALSGLYCTHQDISPEYASILLGITNTVGAVPGIVGVALTGYLFDTTHSWSLSLFAPSIFFYLTGTVVWLAFASSKPQSFSKTD